MPQPRRVTDRPPLPPLRDDGLPTLPTGEPVLHRWFVIAMLILVPLALAVSIWAATQVFGREVIPPAERRPAGDATTTVDRGDAVLGTIEDSEPGPSCASAIRVVGDPGAIAAGQSGARCRVLAAAQRPVRGRRGGARASGSPTADSCGSRSSSCPGSSRRCARPTTALVLELNASYQFEDATRAAPAIIHQLTLLADPGWPGATITADRALLGAEAQAAACDRLVFDSDPPRGCLDVAELLAEDDPIASLRAAGYAG